MSMSQVHLQNYDGVSPPRTYLYTFLSSGWGPFFSTMSSLCNCGRLIGLPLLLLSLMEDITLAIPQSLVVVPTLYAISLTASSMPL